MSLSRWDRRVWIGVAAAVAAAGVVWWCTRVHLPEVPSPNLDPSADPAVVADVTAARDGC